MTRSALTILALLAVSACQTTGSEKIQITIKPADSCLAMVEQIAERSAALREAYGTNASIGNGQKALGIATFIPVVGIGAAAVSMGAGLARKDTTTLRVEHDALQDELNRALASGRCTDTRIARQ